MMTKVFLFAFGFVAIAFAQQTAENQGEFENEKLIAIQQLIAMNQYHGMIVTDILNESVNKIKNLDQVVNDRSALILKEQRKSVKRLEDLATTLNQIIAEESLGDKAKTCVANIKKLAISNVKYNLASFLEEVKRPREQAESQIDVNTEEVSFMKFRLDEIFNSGLTALKKVPSIQLVLATFENILRNSYLPTENALSGLRANIDRAFVEYLQTVVKSYTENLYFLGEIEKGRSVQMKNCLFQNKPPVASDLLAKIEA